MLELLYKEKNMTLTIKSNAYFAPYDLEIQDVAYEKGNFFVTASGRKVEVQRADLCQELRGISTEKLQKLTELGYLTIQGSKDSYSIRYHQRAPAGGPWVALATGLIVKGAGVALCFTPAAGVGAALIAAAPAAAAAVLVLPTP
jgi:hypothetical protein